MGLHAQIIPVEFHGSSMIEPRELETANEIISMSDQTNHCLEIAQALMLHICSDKVRGRIMDMAVQLEAELSSLAANTQRLTRLI